MKKLINIFMVIMTGSIAFGLMGCSSNKAKTVNSDNKEISIGFPSSGNAEIGGLIGWADEKGYLKEELEKAGYTFNMTGFAGAGPAVNEALVTGQINMAAYADFPGLVAKAGGNNIDLIGILTEESNAEIIVGKGSDIQTLEDLKGKKIGFTKGTFSQKFLYDALGSVGLTIDDVEAVNLSAEAESSLLTGSIDALCTVVQLTARLRTSEGAKLISSTTDKEIWGSTMGIFVNHKYATENKEALTALFTALLRAKEDIQQDYEPYLQANAEIINMTLDVCKELYLLDNGEFNYIPIGVSEIAKNKIIVSKDFLLNEGLISNDIDIEAFIDNSYYEEALALYK